MDDLIAFLKARLDEEERLAQSGDLDSPDLTLRLDDRLAWISVTPARVLREVEAKRRILDTWPDPFGNWSAAQADAARAMKERTLKLLALPYADHEAYREEWKP